MIMFELIKNCNIEEMADLFVELNNGDCGNCCGYEFCNRVIEIPKWPRGSMGGGG